MKQLTLARATLLGWLAAYWPPRRRARELARQYGALSEECPLVLADLARFCMAFDSTFDPENARVSDVNQGKREVFLHIKEMLDLSNDDLQRLKEETERE